MREETRGGWGGDVSDRGFATHVWGGTDEDYANWETWVEDAMMRNEAVPYGQWRMELNGIEQKSRVIFAGVLTYINDRENIQATLGRYVSPLNWRHTTTHLVKGAHPTPPPMCGGGGGGGGGGGR
jgi:hypothetical protein